MTTTPPPVRSDQDVVAVKLLVGDWKRIRDGLREDADAEPAGPAAEALLSSYRDNDLEEMQQRAEQHDAEATFCHETGAATRRCAEVIDKALRRHEQTE